MLAVVVHGATAKSFHCAGLAMVTKDHLLLVRLGAGTLGAGVEKDFVCRFALDLQFQHGAMALVGRATVVEGIPAFAADICA